MIKGRYIITTSTGTTIRTWLASPWQQAAFASQALLIGTWTKSKEKNVSPDQSIKRKGSIHTGDQNGDVEGGALNTNIATSKNSTEQTSVRSITHLLDLVAAVKLSITTSLNTLLNGVVTANLGLIRSAVAAVLTVVTNLLIASAVVTGGLNLVGDEGRCRDAESESEDGKDVKEHDDGFEEVLEVLEEAYKWVLNKKSE